VDTLAPNMLLGMDIIGAELMWPHAMSHSPDVQTWFSLSS
jgi:hypothetical protein